MLLSSQKVRAELVGEKEKKRGHDACGEKNAGWNEERNSLSRLCVVGWGHGKGVASERREGKRGDDGSGEEGGRFLPKLQFFSICPTKIQASKKR